MSTSQSIFEGYTGNEVALVVLGTIIACYIFIILWEEVVMPTLVRYIIKRFKL